MSNCIRISSPSLHSSSLAVLSSGVCTSSSSLLRLAPVLVELAIVTPMSLAPLPPILPPPLLRLLFLNHPRLLFVLAASVSEVTEAAYSELLASVLSVLVVVLALEGNL